MAYKQYPTVQQMVGMFQGLAQQQLEREKLEADKRHQKQYGKYLAGKLRLEEQQAGLLKAQQEALNNYRADQLMLDQMRLDDAFRKEQSALAGTAIDLVNKRLEAEYANMAPDSTIKDEKFTELYGSLWQQLSALGLSAQETGQILSSMPVLSKPAEKITVGQEFQVLATMPKEGMSDDALKNLAEQMNKLSGKKIFTAEMLKSKDDTAGQRGMRATIVDLIGEQRLSPDDAESLIRLIDIKDFKGLAVELAETIKPKPLRLMPAAVFNAELEAIKYLPEEQQEKAKVELVARQRTAYSHEIGERKEFHAVTIFKDPDAWLLKGKTIEPLDFETAHTLYKEGKVSQADMSQFSQFVLGVDQTSPDNTEPKPSNKSGKKWTAPGGFKPEE